jgi:hypothetical protein
MRLITFIFLTTLPFISFTQDSNRLLLGVISELNRETDNYRTATNFGVSGGISGIYHLKNDKWLMWGDLLYGYANYNNENYDGYPNEAPLCNSGASSCLKFVVSLKSQEISTRLGIGRRIVTKPKYALIALLGSEYKCLVQGRYRYLEKIYDYSVSPNPIDIVV